MDRESDIKAAVIDEWLSRESVSRNSVIINEFPVGSQTRRADLVMANGRLWAVEIKSEFDTIDRLAKQISAYSKTLESVSVVVAERHLDAVRAMLPSGTGLLVYRRDDQAATVERILKPSFNRLDAIRALRLMHTVDIKKVLKEHSLSFSNNLSRYELEDVARKRVSAYDLRQAAIVALKCRYSPYYSKFLKSRSQTGSSFKSLKHLKKPRWNLNSSSEERKPEEMASISEFEFVERLVVVDGEEKLLRTRARAV